MSDTPEAQIEQAQAAFARGDARAARTLLHAASKSGNPDAVYAYAVALAYGQGGPLTARKRRP
jgi:hypothetical protein